MVRTLKICAANGVLNSRRGEASMSKSKSVQKNVPHTHQLRGYFDSSNSRRSAQLYPPHKTKSDVVEGAPSSWGCRARKPPQPVTQSKEEESWHDDIRAGGRRKQGLDTRHVRRVQDLPR